MASSFIRTHERTPKKGFEAGKWRENGEKKAAGEKKERKMERRIERKS